MEGEWICKDKENGMPAFAGMTDGGSRFKKKASLPRKRESRFFFFLKGRAHD